MRRGPTVHEPAPRGVDPLGAHRVARIANRTRIVPHLVAIGTALQAKLMGVQSVPLGLCVGGGLRQQFGVVGHVMPSA